MEHKRAEINDDSRGTCNTNSQIEIKTSMINSGLFGYSDAYILLSGDITVVGAGANNAAIAVDRNNKQVKFKSYEMFTAAITEINNT